MQCGRYLKSGEFVSFVIITLRIYAVRRKIICGIGIFTAEKALL